MGRWLVPLALFATVGLGLAYVLRSAGERGSFSDSGSTFRAAPDGSRGLFLLAEEVGLPVQRRHVNLEVIEDEGTIVLLDIHGGTRCRLPESKDEDEEDEDEDEEDDEERVLPSLTGLGVYRATLGEHECTALLRWVDAGGSLVHVVSQNDALLEEVGLEFVPDDADADADADESEETVEDEDEDEGSDENEDDEHDRLRFRPLRRKATGPVVELMPGQPTPLVGRATDVRAEVAGHLLERGTTAISVLVERVPRGEGLSRRTVAMAVPYGAGWVVAIAAPQLAANRHLATADNAQFWVGLLAELTGAGIVSFDEFHHGHGGGRSIMGYAMRRGLLPALLQILLVVLVATLVGRRLGKPFVLERETPRSSADYLAAISHLYQQGRHAAHAAEAIAARALRRSAPHRGRPAVAAAAQSLETVVARLRGGADSARGLTEVARRAAAVYDAVASRPTRGRGRRETWSSR